MDTIFGYFFLILHNSTIYKCFLWIPFMHTKDWYYSRKIHVHNVSGCYLWTRFMDTAYAYYIWIMFSEQWMQSTDTIDGYYWWILFMDSFYGSYRRMPSNAMISTIYDYALLISFMHTISWYCISGIFKDTRYGYYLWIL